MTDRSLPLWKSLLFWGITLVGIPILALLLLEGASSFVLFARDLSRPVVDVLPAAHTDYDTLLGWVNRRGFRDRDLYGHGIYFRTNAQGFRNDHDFTTAVPPGRVRLICSGDSFTLGYDVDNEHAWCAVLERKHPRLETVNMGQGGYGVDQVYLWYKRDGQALDHDLQVFAVIVDDFQRMQLRKFPSGGGEYAKPVLALEGDSLRVGNVPVPRWSYRMPRLVAFLHQKRPALTQLRVAQLAETLHTRFAPDPKPSGSAAADSATWQVADRVFADLTSVNRAKGSILVVLFLPTQGDWSGSASDRWRRWLRLAEVQRGFVFVDLVEDLRAMPRDSIAWLFYKAPPVRPGGASGHYGELGNEWVADRLYRHLLALPATAARLDTSLHDRQSRAPPP
jgi:hypothetical protein